MRAIGSWRDCSAMKRWTGGARSIGERFWQFPFRLFYGSEWWEVFSGGFQQFMQFATHQTKIKGIRAGAVPVSLEECDELRVIQEDSLQERLRLSGRLGQRKMKTTQGDWSAGGVPNEITGGSMLVICWFCALWKAENHAWQSRIDAVVIGHGDMCSLYNMRPAEACRGRSNMHIGRGMRRRTSLPIWPDRA
eukprot:4171814-Pyramimonas_sp.AAC.1